MGESIPPPDTERRAHARSLRIFARWTLPIVVTGLLLAAQPAQASVWDTRYPQVVQKLSDTHRTRSGQPFARVVVEVHARRAWGAQRIARHYSSKVGGLQLRVGRCHRAQRAHCLRVYGGSYGRTSWWGLLTPWSRIDMNRRHGVHQMVACHEIGHALGLTHHSKRHGCLRNGSMARWPSPAELRALRRAY